MGGPKWTTPGAFSWESACFAESEVEINCRKTCKVVVYAKFGCKMKLPIAVKRSM